MNETVTLEWFEIEVASIVGLTRCIENHRQNIGYGWNYDKNFEIGVKDSVQGALAEQAFAKKLNIYYCLFFLELQASFLEPTGGIIYLIRWAIIRN